MSVNQPPQSRVEEGVHSMIGDQVELEPSQSRVEKIIHSMCGEQITLEPPQSRLEEDLLALKEVIEQGGGTQEVYAGDFTPTLNANSARSGGWKFTPKDNLKVAGVRFFARDTTASVFISDIYGNTITSKTDVTVVAEQWNDIKFDSPITLYANSQYVVWGSNASSKMKYYETDISPIFVTFGGTVWTTTPSTFPTTIETETTYGVDLIVLVSRAVIEPLSVIQNGTYTPPSGVNGYSPVVVNVSGGGGEDEPSACLKIGTTNPVVNASGIVGPMLNNNTDYIIPTSESGDIKLDLSQPFEIGCKFKISSAPGTYGRNIWGSRNSYYHCPTMCIFNDKVGIYITTNGSSWNVSSGEAITPSGYTFPLDTWVTATMTWDGTDFTFTFDDGSDIYTATKENITPYYNSSYSFEFGGQNRSDYSIAACGASIDLNHTYLKQGDVYIWKASGGGSVRSQ